MVGATESCVIVRHIGSSVAVRIPSLKQYGVVSSTHLTDESYEDIQQLLNLFKPGEKFQ